MNMKIVHPLIILAIIALVNPTIITADTILDDFQVNIEPPGHPPQNSPYSVADWATETIYTTWLSQRDGTNRDVGLQLFDYDLQTLGEASYLNVREGNYDCKRPRLVVGNQGVGAAWIEERTPNRILVRSLDASGNPLCPPVRVEDNYENVARDSLSIAALEDGYVLVWYDERDSSAIYAQIVDFDGNLIGDNFPIRPDSIGGIIALEAQNHPDGRVLVSWVTEGQYSRGRWMDADGNFMGDVFDMADAWIDDEIANSIVRFENGGCGLLYQYSNLVVGNSWDWVKYIYFTYLDSTGLQLSPRIEMGVWLGHWDEYSSYSNTSYSFPDLIFLPYNNYIKIRLYHHDGYAMGGYWWDYTYNKLYSSVFGDYVIPWGIVGAGEYELCQLSSENFLYTFDLEYIGLRTYEISTMDSSQQTSWIGEPDIGAPQSGSEICVHQDGSFRVIYNNWLGPEPLIYTRFFYASGAPSTPDTLVSMSGNYCAVMTSAGRIVKASNENDLVIWPYGGDILGTMYSGSSWNAEIHSFGCDPPVHFPFPPSIDLNADDHVTLLWKSRWWEHWYEDYIEQLFFQSFSQIFTPLTSSFSVSPVYTCATGPCDIGLMNDGRFLVCRKPYSEILIQPGINYSFLIGEPISTGNLSGSAPILEKSIYGYCLAWIWNADIYIQLIDGDGNLLGDALLISEEEAMALGDPGLAGSETGHFAVVWQDARFDEGDLFCRQFNPDGSTFGREYRVNSDPVGPLQKEPAVAFGPEDRLYFTWTDFRNEGGQGDIYCKVIEWNDALSVQEEPAPIPYKFALYPPSPNPFNAVTKITFELPVRSYVKLQVFDIAGRRAGVVREPPLQNQWLDAGIHNVLFDGSGLASGVYIVRLEAGDQAASRKLVLMK